MNVSRRFFIGGLGAFALGPNRIFAAKAGTFTGGKKSSPLVAKPLEAGA